jgi:hypothetical protein
VVNAFLTQVCDIPAGWGMGPGADVLPADTPLGPGGELPMAIIDERRNAGPESFGFIAGDLASRQFQIIAGPQPNIWSVCISTRDIEGVYERAQARGVPCTPITVADWSEQDNIRNFFSLVDGLLVEVIRVEPKST